MKYLIAVSKPAFWPAIARGVMPAVEHIDALKPLNPRTVIDVGANKGQFSIVARRLFPSAQIHAFEPLEEARRVYQKVVAGPVQIHALALGAERGSATFFVASRPDSSSLLAPGKMQAAYGVALSSTTTVTVDTLDSVLAPQNLERPVLLKLDVQGGELDVLRGAEKVLHFVDAVHCEVSFVELYDHQPTAATIVSFFDRREFGLRGAFNLSVTEQFGPTQADFLFVRNPKPAAASVAGMP